MDSGNKGISIVVPSHGRVPLLERLLISLKEAREAYNGETEVLIIDSSSAEERIKIKSLCEIWDAKLYFIKNHVCLKRNYGVAKSKYDIVFFIDSDCEAEKDVLVSHIGYRKENNNSPAVIGFTDWTGPRTPIWKILDLVTGFGSAFNFSKWFDVVPWGTCTNFMVEKSWLIKIGGFDESSPVRVFGDDVDLGLRLSKVGCEIRSNPDAVVNHSREPFGSFQKVLRKYFLSGRSDFYLGKRHPERLQFDQPGPVVMILILLIMASARVLTGGSSMILLFPLFWGLIFICFSSLFLSIGRKRKIASFGYQFLALIPSFFFEAGRFYESMKNMEPAAITYKFVYIKEQLEKEKDWKKIKLFLFFLTIPPAIIIIYMY